MWFGGDSSRTPSINRANRKSVYVQTSTVDISKLLLSPVTTAGGHNYTKSKCFGHYSVAEVNWKQELIS